MTDKIISLGDFRKKKEDFSEDSFPDFDDIFGDIFEEDFDDELPSENPFTIGDNLPLIDSIYQEYLDSKRLLENGRATWLAQGPHGWLNLDERDYLALACNHATIAKQMCLYDQALAIFQEIYQLDTNDPLELRYQLMATYLLKQDWQALQAFFDSQDYFAEDEGMLVYMTIASLFQDKLDATKDYLDPYHQDKRQYERHPLQSRIGCSRNHLGHRFPKLSLFLTRINPRYDGRAIASHDLSLPVHPW